MNPNRSEHTLLLGVSGGIAAYKSAALASLLRKEGWNVTVSMTTSAIDFVTPLTFAAVSGQAVQTDASARSDSEVLEDAYPHLYPATRAVACILAPATANLIAKAANGIADDLLTTSLLSLPSSCIKLFCPAMNVEMWRQPVVQQNVAKLEALGWQRIGPDSGPLACGAIGEGRMAEPNAIAGALRDAHSGTDALNGRRILITSGPTVEHIDPVRFISNHSSGRMGKALAEAAAASGAQVDFVTGPVAQANLPHHPNVTVRNVVSAHEMLEAARDAFADADAAIFVAAVADYTPGAPMPHKEPKKLTGLSIPLVPNHDIAKELCAIKRSEQRCIGFALETHDGVKRAQGKLQRKRFDAIVLNGVSSFGGDSGHFTWIAGAADPAIWGDLTKSTCAKRIIEHVADSWPT